MSKSSKKHIVLFSGGIGSWAAAKRVVAKHSKENTILLFTDTKAEDEDLYRFIDEAAANVGAELVKIADGRDIWQVYLDKKFMGNSRVDPCSRILKRELADRWINDRFKPSECACYVGIDWTEEHRYTAMAARKLPYQYYAPLCEKPLIMKPDMIKWAEDEGLKPPRLYAMGFQHNNCGGFCVKAGQAHFKTLYQAMPERYLEMEKREEAVYKKIGRYPFLRVTRDKKMHYVTLREFRTQFLEPQCEIDEHDFGGCGCFTTE